MVEEPTGERIPGRQPTGRQPTGRLLPYGERGLLVEVNDLHRALALFELLATAREHLAGLEDVVAGARSVLLVAASPGALTAVRAEAQRALAAVGSGEVPTASNSGGPAPEQVVEVPVHYDGDDLADVAELTGLTVTEVVAAHTGTPWRVGFAGFAPGFAYLVDGDPRLRVPRRAAPRPRVPAGSVGLADEFSGVYPRSSPGGWQLLGHTDLALWDLHRDPPALLRPGLWVQFTDADGAS